MDQLFIIAVSSAVGYAGAYLYLNRRVVAFKEAVAEEFIKSLSKLADSCVRTLIEDFDIPPEKATDALFKRAKQSGMVLKAIDRSTGKTSEIEGK